MIKQGWDYLESRKQTFLRKSLLWGAIIMILFSIGWMITKQRANPATIIAGVLVVAFAQNLTRYLSFRKYKGPSKEEADVFEILPNGCSIYHGCIIPCEKTTLYFEHIVITATDCFFIRRHKGAKSDGELIKRLMTKGITQKHIHFIENTDSNQIIKTLENKVSTVLTDKETSSLEQHMQIIEGLIM